MMIARIFLLFSIFLFAFDSLKIKPIVTINIHINKKLVKNINIDKIIENINKFIEEKVIEEKVIEEKVIGEKVIGEKVIGENKKRKINNNNDAALMPKHHISRHYNSL
jgi:hypothetical protein